MYKVPFQGNGDILEVNDSHGYTEMTIYGHSQLSTLKHLSL